MDFHGAKVRGVLVVGTIGGHEETHRDTAVVDGRPHAQEDAERVLCYSLQDCRRCSVDTVQRIG